MLRGRRNNYFWSENFIVWIERHAVILAIRFEDFTAIAVGSPYSIRPECLRDHPFHIASLQSDVAVTSPLLSIRAVVTISSTKTVEPFSWAAFRARANALFLESVRPSTSPN